MLIDTHAHLDLTLEKLSLEEIQKSLQEYSIDGIIHIGADKKGISFIEENILKKKLPFSTYFAIGMHPHEYREDISFFLEKIDTYLSHPLCKALGEVGLDYYYHQEEEAKKKQREIFEKMIEKSLEGKKTLVIHSRSSFEDTYFMLKEVSLEIPVVLHCFSYSKEEARKFLDRGMYLSFTGLITFKNAWEVQDACKYAPLDRILVETDSPFLAPYPYRGKVNRPGWVYWVFKKIVDLKKISEEDLLSYINQTTQEVYFI